MTCKKTKDVIEWTVVNDENAPPGSENEEVKMKPAKMVLGLKSEELLNDITSSPHPAADLFSQLYISEGNWSEFSSCFNHSINLYNLKEKQLAKVQHC